MSSCPRCGGARRVTHVHAAGRLARVRRTCCEGCGAVGSEVIVDLGESAQGARALAARIARGELRVELLAKATRDGA